jgi:hypothetical protein
MTVRDLGYRPYEGVRLPPANNTWVMLRHGLARAWASWLVKIAVLLSGGPLLVFAVYVALRLYMTRQMGGGAEGIPEFDGTEPLRYLYSSETWLAVSLLTLGAGAPAIAEDLTFRAFQFYFAKPVTPEQYYGGRALAVAIPIFAITFVPAIIVDLVMVAMSPVDQATAMLGLLLPCFVYSLVLAIVMGAGSVAISSLSKSRALTMSAWVLCFVVPHALAAVVEAIGHWPWLYLASFTGLLGTIADALFHVDSDSDLHWWHALPVLGLFVAGSIALSLHRLRTAEVIT